MRYDAKTSLQTQGTSRHFIAFLAHEAFHYYMQNNWPAGGRFMEDLSKTDIDWMEKQYSNGMFQDRTPPGPSFRRNTGRAERMPAGRSKES